MKDQNRTKKKPIAELKELRHRIIEQDQLKDKRKQARETLWESKNYYRTLVENLPQKIFLKDKNSVYLSCNENYSRDLKMGPAEIVGKTDYDFYPKELAEKYRADDKRIMESRKTEDIEERYIQDGKEIIVHTVKTPIKDEKGRVVGILGIFWDITKSKHADDELKKYRERLEELVEERTTELRMANEQFGREIIERRQLEEVLREYQKAIEASKDMIAVVDRNYNYLLANNAFLKYRDMDREQVVGRSVPELLGKDVFEGVIKKSLDTSFQGEIVQYEMKYPYPELGERDLLVSYIPIEGPDGINRVVSVIRDITELKQIVNELQTEKQRFQTLSENAPFGMVMIDKDGTFRYMNPKFRELFGYDLNDVPDGRTWFRRAYPDPPYRDHVISTWVNDLDSSSPGEKRPRIFTMTCKDGTEKIINFIPVQLETGENLMTCEDVTERKRAEEALRQSEEKYRTILENMQEVYYEVDLAGNWIFLNEAFYEHLGYTKEELIGKKSRQYQDETTAGELYQAYTRLYRTGEPIKAVEAVWISKDGAKRTYEMSASLIRDSKGKPTGFRGISRDVTERKQMEEALRENENRLQALLDASPVGISWADMDGNIKYVNRKFVQLFGYTVEDIPTVAEWRRLVYPDPAHRETVPSLIAKLTEARKQGREIRPMEMTIKCKDGSTRYVEQMGTFVSNRILAIYNDLTERKQMEEALRESENKFRSLVENSIVGVYLVQDGLFKYVNSRISDISGYKVEEMVDKMGPKHTALPEDLSIVEGNIGKRIRNGEESVHYEFRTVTKSQEIRTVEVFGSRTMYQGRPAVIGTMLDITDRKKAEEALRQSEEKYRTILESIEDGYYEVDLAGNLTFFNDSMCRIWGYPKEELIGMNNRKYTDKENAKKVFRAFNRVYRTEEPGRELDWEIIRKDGTKRFIEASVSLRKDTLGKPIGFRGIIRDITDRKRIEEQLFQAEKLRAVGEMASGVAHDFNNALAAILGNTQLLLYTAQDGELKETLKIIEQVAKDSSRTVRRLQDFTRRPVPQELFKVDINSVIKDSIEITKPRWKDEAQSRGMGIEIVSNLEDIPLASGSASELREVITNMIFNAVEAMHEGGRIEIRTFKKRRDIFIQISDTGVGIAEEAKKRIFEPFFTTKPFSNTGLGLSMCYGIIKRFGGEIEVVSELGYGTTFTITLPIGEEGKEEAVDPQPIKKGRRAHILVIDDEEFVRSVLSRTLAQADHQVTLAEDGRKGVELFKEGKFDIVLTDLGMPGVSGWEVCRMIKEISPHTPVGMITGWGGERSQSKMEEYGLDFFISKPFDFAEILNVVAKTMESRKE
ncbi:MAG TPA: PAS domain S-box protein [Thermodesulfobacteriota bacterium]|nr:PAS domain S-box protein [Thermodesulfobacteriota bacterium]